MSDPNQDKGVEQKSASPVSGVSMKFLGPDEGPLSAAMRADIRKARDPKNAAEAPPAWKAAIAEMERDGLVTRKSEP